jgi:hypothetical protein
MAFLPDNTQDVSGIPSNDVMAQLDLQRRLKMAQQLQQSQAPEGQMISGHYVAPSWTQSLANVASKYIGSKAEENAMKQYGDYTKSKEQKMANALKKLGGAFEPITTTSTEMQPTEMPLQQGMNVPTSPFQTTEQVNQVAPNYSGQAPVQNMSGITTQMNPVTKTSTTQPTLADIEKAFGQYATDVNNPKLLESILSGRYEKMVKANEPVKLGAGESVFNATGTKLFGNPKEETPGTLEKNYNFALSKGYKGSIQDFERIATNYINPHQAAQLEIEKKKLNPLGLPDLSTPITKPLTNKQGWTLHTDAQGNQAYVSPDGKQFEETK